MPFTRPTLQQLIERINADIEARLAGTEPRLRRSVLGTLARSWAASVYSLHGHLDWIARQVIPATADREYLEAHCDWWGITRRPATPAGGAISCTGTDGAVIPVGAGLLRSDGAKYVTGADAVIVGGTATINVVATTPGQNGNAAPGTRLTWVSPVAGVQSQATVAAGGLTGGSDIESDDALRARLRQHVQRTPQGGAIADYEAWALEVPGVTRVWVREHWVGLGTIGLFFTRDDDASPIPDASAVQAMRDHLDSRRPVGMGGLYVMAPAGVAVPVTVRLAPNTPSVQAAVTAELRDLFRRQAVEDGSGNGTLPLSHIQEAISGAAGETDHVLVAPAANVVLSGGQLAMLGAITFQAL